MIKINLALRKQAASVTGDSKSGAIGTGSWTDLLGKTGSMSPGMNMDSLKELPLKQIALMAVVAILATYLLDDYKASEVQKVADAIGKATEQQQKLKADLLKTKGYEELKKALDKDEATLRTKIDVIQKLLADRQVSPKMMVALAGAIPADTWLRALKIHGNEVELSGTSLGLNSISDFMRELNSSAYLTEVQLKGTKQDHDSGVEVAVFDLTAKRR